MELDFDKLDKMREDSPLTKMAEDIDQIKKLVWAYCNATLSKDEMIRFNQLLGKSQGKNKASFSTPEGQ